MPTRRAVDGDSLLTFWLGTHKTVWLERTAVPLFVSHRELAARAGLPRARGPWALDSGGFSELSLFGRWATSPGAYAAACRRYAEEVGGLAWVAPQDWMVEPHVLEKTRLTVADHQRLTIASFLELREKLGELVIPVLQGWARDDYLRHRDAYEAAGVELETERLVGVGSVCRRRASAGPIIRALAGLRLHGFGVKMHGLLAYGDRLASADSLAWSYHARRRPPLPGHEHKNCANCLPYALAWRERIVRSLEHRQLELEVAA